jgi:hypothetical protein
MAIIHLPDDTFASLALETCGCLDWAFDEVFGRLALDGLLSFGEEVQGRSHWHCPD